MAKLGTSSKMIYLKTVNGKFAQSVNEVTHGAEKRTTKNGKVVYEKYYPNVSGVITKMEIRTNEFQDISYDSTCFTIDDEIQLQLSGGISNDRADIINSMLSDEFDITKEVTFCIGRDGEYYNVFILQDGKGVKRYSTKADPKDVPPAVKKTVAGKDKWDFDERNNYFYEKFLELAKKAEANEPNKELPESVFIQKEPKEEVCDDLPEIPAIEHKQTVDPANLPF